MQKDWHYHFATLDEYDRKYPMWTIQEFCAQDTIFNVRALILDLFSLAMGSENWKSDDPLEKTNKMWKLLQLTKLVEVVYHIDQLGSAGRLNLSIGEE